MAADPRRRTRTSGGAAGAPAGAGDRDAALVEAWQALEAAFALLEDAMVPVRHARRPLAEAAEAAARAGLSVPGALPEEGARRAEVRRWARELGARVERARRAAGADRLRGQRRRRILRRVGALLAWASPVLAYLGIVPFEWREGAWRGEFFPTKEFQGESRVRRHSDLAFHWKKAAPFRDFPDDAFSARFDTCLELAEAADAVFRLQSDDGSRLFVDGVLVVDNWGGHPRRARSGEFQLDPGIHHLRVEYFENTGPAELELDASFYGERPRAIPARLLHYPGEILDPAAPCAGVRPRGEVAVP